MTFTAALPTKQMDGDNNNSNIPTDKGNHMEVLYLPGCRSLSHHICKRRRHTQTQSPRNTHTHTHTHTHTQRKVIKQAKMLDPQRETGFRTDSWSRTQAATQAGKLQWCKWPQRIFPRLPLPASVRPFLLLSSSFMSSFSASLIIHLPESPLGRCLPFLSAPIKTLTCCRREPPTCYCSQETPRLP